MLNPNITNISNQISKMSMFVDQDPDGKKTAGIFSGILEYLYSDGSKDVQSFISLGDQTERILDWFFESHGIKSTDLGSIPFVLKKKIFDRFIELKRTKGSSATNYVLMEMFVDIGMDIVSYRIIVDKPIGTIEPSFIFEPLNEKSKGNIPPAEKEMFLVKHWDELSTYTTDAVYPMRTNIIYHKVKQPKTDNKVPMWIYNLKMMSDAIVDQMVIPLYINGKTYNISAPDIEIAISFLLHKGTQQINMIDTIDHTKLNTWYTAGIKLSEKTGDVDMVKAREVVHNIQNSYTTKTVLIHDYIGQKYPDFYANLIVHDVGTIDTINMAKILKLYLGDKPYGEYMVTLLLDKVISGGETEMYIRPLIEFFDEYFQIVYQETILDMETIVMRIDDLFQKIQLADDTQIETIVNKNDLIPLLDHGVIHLWYKLTNDSTFRLSSETRYLVVLENLKRIHGVHKVTILDSMSYESSSAHNDTVGVMSSFYNQMILDAYSSLTYADYFRNRIGSNIMEQFRFTDIMRTDLTLDNFSRTLLQDPQIVTSGVYGWSHFRPSDMTTTTSVSLNNDLLGMTTDVTFSTNLSIVRNLSYGSNTILIGSPFVNILGNQKSTSIYKTDDINTEQCSWVYDNMMQHMSYINNLNSKRSTNIGISDPSTISQPEPHIHSSNFQTDEVDAEIIHNNN